MREQERVRRQARRAPRPARERCSPEQARQTKRAAARRYYTNHLAEEQTRKRIDFATHKDARHLSNAKYRADHPEQKRAYYRAHAEELRDAGHRYRSRLTGDRIDQQAVYDRDGGRCHICGLPVERTLMSLDHIFPLSPPRGSIYAPGTHSLMNVRCSHRRCNFRRGNRGPGQPYLL